MLEKEIIPVSDIDLPIKNYIVDSNERKLSAGLHIHDELEIIYIMEGSMIFYVGSDTVPVRQGSIIIINSLTAHSSEVEGEQCTKISLLQFDPAVIYNPSVVRHKYLLPFLQNQSFRYSLINAANFPQYSHMVELLLEINHEFMSKGIAYEILIKSNLYRILNILYRNKILTYNLINDHEKDQFLLERLTPVLDFVGKNYKEQITLLDVCRLLNLNYNYFCRLFKTAVGKPFVQYLNFVRVSEAERQLVMTEKPVTDIILDTGFSSLSYFNRVFKKMKGFSPSEYRKLLKN